MVSFSVSRRVSSGLEFLHSFIECFFWYHVRSLIGISYQDF